MLCAESWTRIPRGVPPPIFVFAPVLHTVDAFCPGPDAEPWLKVLNTQVKWKRNSWRLCALAEEVDSAVCPAEKRHLAPAPMLPRKASHDVRHGQETLEALRHGVVNTEVNTQFEPKLPCGKYSEKYNAHAPKGRPSKFLFLSVKSPHNKNIIALCSARWQIYNWCFTIATCPARHRDNPIFLLLRASSNNDLPGFAGVEAQLVNHAMSHRQLNHEPAPEKLLFFWPLRRRGLFVFGQLSCDPFVNAVLRQDSDILRSSFVLSTPGLWLWWSWSD